MLFILSFFLFSFFNPIFAWTALSGFRFTGNKFFSLPHFAWIAFIGCQSAGCSFLPKPPFRVFNLAGFSFAFFSNFHSFFSFFSCHWPQIILGNKLLVTCIEIVIDTHLSMHVSLECTLLLRFVFKIDGKDFFNFQKCLFQTLTLSKWKENILYIALKIERKIEFQTTAQAQIDVEEWKSAKGITPRIYKVWKMVILLVGSTLNTMTATFHRNFEFTSTEASDEDDHWQLQMPQGVMVVCQI